jgi:hypothetical protein
MQNSRTTQKVAIIGSGFGFQELLPVLSSLENTKICLMKPRDYSKPKYSRYESLNVSFASLDEIANNQDIKLVFVALPPFLQSKVVESLAPLGKSIYLEKPGGLNSEEALKIERVIRKHGVNLYLGFQFRFDPVIKMSTEYVGAATSTLEKYANIEWTIKKPPTADGWKQDPDRGGGVYRDHLCHIIDLLRNGYGFSDEQFNSKLILLSETKDLIDKVHLKSSNVEINIVRDYDISSSLKIIIESESDQFVLKSQYPFKLGDYVFMKNKENINLPKSLNLDHDSRRAALRSYINMVLLKEFKKDSHSDKTSYPSIIDAIFTQKIADQIYSLK